MLVAWIAAVLPWARPSLLITTSELGGGGVDDRLDGVQRLVDARCCGREPVDAGLRRCARVGARARVDLALNRIGGNERRVRLGGRAVELPSEPVAQPDRETVRRSVHDPGGDEAWCVREIVGNGSTPPRRQRWPPVRRPNSCRRDPAHPPGRRSSPTGVARSYRCAQGRRLGLRGRELRERACRSTLGCSAHEGFRPRIACMASNCWPLSSDRLLLATARLLTLAEIRCDGGPRLRVSRGGGEGSLEVLQVGAEARPELLLGGAGRAGERRRGERQGEQARDDAYGRGAGGG